MWALWVASKPALPPAFHTSLLEKNRVTAPPKSVECLRSPQRILMEYSGHREGHRAQQHGQVAHEPRCPSQEQRWKWEAQDSILAPTSASHTGGSQYGDMKNQQWLSVVSGTPCSHVHTGFWSTPADV